MDYNHLLSPVARSLKPSGIRKFFDIVNTMEDAISLGVGEPDFDTPWQVRRAGITALEKGRTFYTSNWGLMDLRREIARYLERRFQLSYHPDNEILVTVGGSEGIDNVLSAVVAPGDEVLIPEPSFVCYEPLTRLAGGVPVPLVTRAEDQFRLTPELLRPAITDKTKLLILPFPNNPTGAIMTREDLTAIADVLRGTDVLVLSDEIYSELTYPFSHTSFAAIPGMRERTVVVNGFSKSYAMTGWRLGYAAGPREIMEQACIIHQYGIMSSPTVSQFAALEALRTGDEDIEHMRNQYNIRRVFLLNRLREIGLECFEAQGAFYLFPSIACTGLTSETFCETLLQEQKVAVVPGNAFGDSGEGFVRISYSYSLTHLKEACDRIERFVQAHRK